MFDDQDSIETAALIDSCDDLQDRAEQIAMPRTGGNGCLMVATFVIVACLYVLLR